MSIANEMQALMDRWVDLFGRGDLEGSVEVYCEDGAIYSPYGLAAVGRDALRATHRDWLAAGETNKRITVLKAEVQGNLAYGLATYSGDLPDARGGLVNESGTSLNIARRLPDGTWRILISSLNSDKPPMAGTTDR